MLQYKNIKLLFFFSIIALLLNSCAEDVEGCLDINASNLNITADKACSDCCTYPSLSFSFDHKIIYTDTSYNLVLGNVYQNNIGNIFTIQKIQFYISNVSLIKENGTEVGVIDTMSFYVKNSTNQSEVQLFTDDFQLINRSAFNYNIGTIEQSGNFTGLKFTVGLNETANKIIPDSLSNHVLAIQNEAMYLKNEASYIFNKIEILPDTSNINTTKEILISGNNQSKVIQFDQNFVLEKGSNATIRIQIDYLSFFKDINFNFDNDQTIKSKILNNTSSVFSLIE